MSSSNRRKAESWRSGLQSWIRPDMRRMASDRASEESLIQEEPRLLRVDRHDTDMRETGHVSIRDLLVSARDLSWVVRVGVAVDEEQITGVMVEASADALWELRWLTKAAEVDELYLGTRG